MRVGAIISKVLHGLLEGFILWSLYSYVVPLVFQRLMTTVPQARYYVKSMIPSTEYLITYLAFFVGLSTAASILSGTVYGPILITLLNVVGFFILLSILRGGVIEWSLIADKTRIDVCIDISVIIVVIFAFITIPSIAFSFLRYVRSSMEKL